MSNVSKTKKQEQSVNNVMGWIITLEPIILAMLGFWVMLPRLPYDAILCFADRESLKRQAIWKKGKIAWGWCLLAPVYLYKRTKLLNESMLKFWLLVIQWCILIFILVAAICLIANAI